MALGTLPTKGLSQTTAHNYQHQCLKFICCFGFISFINIITLPISNSVSCPGIQQNQGRGKKKEAQGQVKGSYVPMIGRLEVSQVTQDIRPWGGGIRVWWPHSLPGITLVSGKESWPLIPDLRQSPGHQSSRPSLKGMRPNLLINHGIQVLALSLCARR